MWLVVALAVLTPIVHARIGVFGCGRLDTGLPAHNLIVSRCKSFRNVTQRPSRRLRTEIGQASSRCVGDDCGISDRPRLEQVPCQSECHIEEDPAGDFAHPLADCYLEAEEGDRKGEEGALEENDGGRSRSSTYRVSSRAVIL